MNNNNYRQLAFTISCLALVVTAMTFAIRAGILSQLSADFSLTDSQLGWVNSMAFLGFPVATILGGLLYNHIGAKRMIIAAFAFHLLGLGLTIGASGFYSLLLSTFFIGFANGAVEAGCNPLIAKLYPDNKTTMLNRFHVWFPGGIVIGALASKFMTDFGFNWQAQIAIMLVPTLVYGALLLKLTLPKEINAVAKGATGQNIKALLSPLFIFMVLCMTLTATTELATQQWIERILGGSGASPMLIMALITGVMALGRYFAGPIIKTLNTLGVLLTSSVLAFIGIFAMSIASGYQLYIAAVIFALGVTYFWPTMLGYVAEKLPQTGALGLSIMGGAGMFAVSTWNPIIGRWIEASKQEVANFGEDKDLIAGQLVLSELSTFPLVLIVAFSSLWCFSAIRAKKQVSQPA
ncbi:putative sialic acid transporter [Pseudoalteromonas sp. P1-9]|uniref:MFS transporter n=1 Tax=Pseudoalteromonas sp. P1-9 TaxID=1710354 RepID=UPI0006D60529|nr:MFS transporter [Pseudoalteromonas sp. P1-9]KPV93735.1 putative sialic acid transporter [Pseudoalteromonas sp. P1-9]